MLELIYLSDFTGSSPLAKWLATLDQTTQARIGTSIYRLSAGNFSSVKGAGAGIYEMRMDFGPGYRVYFGKDGDTLIILLGGGTKKRQQNDIEAAQTLWQTYKQGKKHETTDKTV